MSYNLGKTSTIGKIPIGIGKEEDELNFYQEMYQNPNRGKCGWNVNRVRNSTVSERQYKYICDLREFCTEKGIEVRGILATNPRNYAEAKQRINSLRTIIAKRGLLDEFHARGKEEED